MHVTFFTSIIGNLILNSIWKLLLGFSCHRWKLAQLRYKVKSLPFEIYVLKIAKERMRFRLSEDLYMQVVNRL